MAAFDFGSEAALLPSENAVEPPPSRSRRGQKPIGYGRFARAADAIRFAMEELPASLLPETHLEVDEKKFDGDGIRRLYESAEYPLARRRATPSLVFHKPGDTHEIPPTSRSRRRQARRR